MAEAAPDLSKAFDAIDREGRDILGREQAELAPAIADAQKANVAPFPARPKLERAPEPPQAQNSFHDAADWISSAVLLSGIAGLATRQPITSAMNAFSGYVKGIHQGDTEIAKQSLDQWKAASDRARDNNAAMLKEYDAALKERDATIEQKMNAVQLVAAKYKDMMTYQAAQVKNFTLVATLIEKQREAGDKMDQAAQKISLMADRLQLDRDKLASGQFDDKTVDMIADQALAGDTSGLQNIGRGTQGAENIKKIRARVAEKADEKGITGDQLAKINAQFQGLKSGERALGTYSTKVEFAANEAKQFAAQALDASAKLPRGRFVPANKAVQAYLAKTSDPALAEFGFANMSLANAYARAVNPTGVPRVESINHALEFLSTATSPEAYQAVVRRLLLEIQGSQKAAGATRAELGGGSQVDLAPPAPGALPPGWKIEQVQ